MFFEMMMGICLDFIVSEHIEEFSWEETLNGGGLLLSRPLQNKM